MIPFIKMQANGNDFIIIDGRNETIAAAFSALTQDQRHHMADRHCGIGCDQILFIFYENSELWVRIYNTDGSESGACGNGFRCVARLLDDGQSNTITFRTLHGVQTARCSNQVSVDIGTPSFDWKVIPLSQDRDPFNLGIPLEGTQAVAAVFVGNPHLVFFAEDLDRVPLEKYGSALEHHPLFPERVNVSVISYTSPMSLSQKIWERGAGLTRSCGTAACAAVVLAHHLWGGKKIMAVQQPGGLLNVEIDLDQHMWLTGTTEIVFRGVWGS